MATRPLSLSKEARQRHPYRSLCAAVLFQSFQDALAETMSEDSPGNRDEVASRERNAVPVTRSMLAQQA